MKRCYRVGAKSVLCSQSGFTKNALAKAANQQNFMLYTLSRSEGRPSLRCFVAHYLVENVHLSILPVLSVPVAVWKLAIELPASGDGAAAPRLMC